MTHVVYENRDTTIHECMFIRLPPGMTGAQYVEAVRNGHDFPEGALDCSGPDVTSPGERAELWLRLDPGTYMLGCWYRGHLKSAPIQTLVVTPDSTTGIVPPPHDATITLKDFEFELDGEIRKGERVVKVVTAGPSMHEMDVYRLDDGRTVDDLRRWMKANMQGPRPAHPMSGVLDQHDRSRVVWFRRDWKPGRYVLWCEMPMVAGVDEAGVHADAGMFREFVVTD